MKKKLSYRDKLLELAYIYNVKEVQDYTKRRKNLTTGQIELILKKNKITIPKDFKTSFFKENFTKPISRLKSNINNYKDEKIKEKNRLFRRVENYKHDTTRKFNSGLNSTWKNFGKVGENLLNIIPILGKAIGNFFGNLFTDVFNSIYNQQIDQRNARNVIIGFFAIVIFTTIIVAGLNTYKNYNSTINANKVDMKKPEVKVKKESKKPELKVKVKEEKKIEKEAKKIEKKDTKDKKEPELKVKQKNVAEVILPDLNLKTETVLNLFKDVNYDLSQVRNNKLVKPIYFTQFPKDLNAIENTRLKKETFIQIVLPLIVAENERILADRMKLKAIYEKKFTSDVEKQWLRQKLLEYKVKRGDLEKLLIRMDIIPTSIALAQAAKESGWGTSRFALEGNAIFGQWTWSGQGIAPLDRASDKSHKILKFPILRASVKAYQNNLNTHKSYIKFREKRASMRDDKKDIRGLDLTDTLKNYAQTGSEYTKTLNQIIKQNRLTDFETVRLVNSIKKVELSS